MFAKLAQDCLRGVGNIRQAPAITDNRAAFRPTAHPYRARRPVLVCHWQQAPTGALECVWEAVGAPPTRELRRQRELEVRRLTDARAAVRRAFRRAA